MSEHDKIIQHIQGKLSVNYKVYSNPSSNKNFNVSGFFPDVIVATKDGSRILFVMEIETEESIVNSVLQWGQYSNLPYVFYVIVPTSKLQDAKNLAAMAGVKAKFGYYSVTQEGGIVVQYE